jgi:cytochrome c oxidase cbb3-type subunit 3
MRKIVQTVPAFLVTLLSPVLSFGAAVEPAAETDFKLDTNDVLIGCALLLLLVLFVLGNTLVSALQFYHEKKKAARRSGGTGTVVTVLTALFLCSAWSVSAQGTADAASATSYSDAEVLRSILYVVLTIEIIVIFLFARMIRFFTGVEAFRQSIARPRKAAIGFAAVWTRMDTGHSYDGIRELNNVTPPWFIAGFALSVLAAGIYLWRYHVSESAPLQIEEYNIAVAEAKIRQEEFLKTQANNVDEFSVVMLDGAGIAAGQVLFASNCVVCHGDKAQGASVGPNLTDKFWLHGGGIKDVFKSIKYGWQEKGMKSWKEDFSPTQIAQLASFIHSLQGSNPPGAKEPQGALYAEADTPQEDSTKAPAQ